MSPSNKTSSGKEHVIPGKTHPTKDLAYDEPNLWMTKPALIRKTLQKILGTCFYEVR